MASCLPAHHVSTLRPHATDATGQQHVSTRRLLQQAVAPPNPLAVPRAVAAGADSKVARDMAQKALQVAQEALEVARETAREVARKGKRREAAAKRRPSGQASARRPQLSSPDAALPGQGRAGAGALPPHALRKAAGRLTHVRSGGVDAAGAASAPHLSDLKVLFGLIGRDVADQLPYTLANIERLGELFHSVGVVLVENDSADDTRGVFASWARNFTARPLPAGRGRSASLLNLTAPHAPSKKDLQTLGLARNVYLEALSSPEYADVDYLIAVDTDMCHKWDVGAMARVLHDLLPFSGTEWHALYSAGICGWYQPSGLETPPHAPGSHGIYCDSFALRGEIPEQLPYDIWLALIPGTCDLSRSGRGVSNHFPVCRDLAGQPVVPVKAAFGGWAMYRASLFRGDKGCRHDPSSSGCEHLSLSACMAERHNARQLIATSLVVDWGGCSEGDQHRWDNWKPSTGT